MAPHYYYWIILGRFSESLQFSCSSSISTPFPFCVHSCCHSYESLLQLLWAYMSVYVTNWVRVYVRMTKTNKTFCNELFKRLLPFERWVCVCFGWVCQMCARVGAHLSVCVCVQYVLSLHLTSFWVRCWRRETAHWTGLQRTGDFLEAFIKTDLSRYYCLISPSLTPLLCSSPSLVSGSVNRNWQANTWERSIALLFFDVCTEAHSWLFLWKLCPGYSSWHWEHKCLCFNLMEL